MPSLPRQAHAAIGLIARLARDGAALDFPLERLFDDLPNLVFFIKDRASRYLAVNRALVERCAFSDKARLIGKRASDFYPAALAARYERQDRQVIETGKPLIDVLELHLYPSRKRGWCLTNKYPMHDSTTGEVAGLIGLSRDVETSPRGAAARGFGELAAALEVAHARIADPPGVEELAALCGLSAPHFSQLVQRLFHLTPHKLLMKIRLDEALHLLATTPESLADIAFATGFCDQSAFTRHFRRLTGLPPGAFREACRALPTPGASGTPGARGSAP
jgi:AraC-like DNA-binding protein